MNIITTKQAADLMGVTMGTIHKWVRDGRITPYGTTRLPAGSGAVDSMVFESEHVVQSASDYRSSVRRNRSINWEEATNSITVTPEFGWWFSGFCDGEACFFVRRAPKAIIPKFTIQLRSDDRPALNLISETLGIGKVIDKSVSGSQSGLVYYKGYKPNPQAEFLVLRKLELVGLCGIFLKYPLRSKKSRDMYTWIEICKEWCQPYPRYDLASELVEKLRTDRKFPNNHQP